MPGCAAWRLARAAINPRKNKRGLEVVAGGRVRRLLDILYWYQHEWNSSSPAVTFCCYHLCSSRCCRRSRRSTTAFVMAQSPGDPEQNMSAQLPLSPSSLWFGLAKTSGQTQRDADTWCGNPILSSIMPERGTRTSWNFVCCRRSWPKNAPERMCFLEIENSQ